MLQSNQPKWKHISEIHKDALEYIKDRKNGLIKSIETPWKKFNDAGIGGLEWGSITTLAARPGGGKTLILNQITRNAHRLNPTQDFAVLDFQFEMNTRSTGVREFSSILKKSYRELLSVDSKITDSDINDAFVYSKTRAGDPIFQVDTPMTVPQMKNTILDFYKFIKKPIIVTLDHSVLLKKAPGEKDIFESLYNLGEMLTELKKTIPCMFIILTQMNRSIEEQTRKIPGTAGNYPTSADVFGADALLMHSDMLVVINRPYQYNLEIYGPEQFEVTEKLLALHFLKTRNGDNKLCFFEAEFENMNIREIAAPNQVQAQTQRYQKRNLSTSAIN
jgi:replicative DNA helicase